MINIVEKTIKLIDIARRIDHKLNNDEAQEIIRVINNYSNALNLLDDYDHKTVVKLKGTNSDNNTLVAITLLIAKSNPKDKNILLDLVMNFLSNE